MYFMNHKITSNYLLFSPSCRRDYANLLTEKRRGKRINKICIGSKRDAPFCGALFKVY